MYYFLIHFKYVIFVNLIQVFLPMIQMTQNARNHDSLTTDVTVQIVQNIIVRVTLITFAKDVYFRFSRHSKC